MELSTLKQTITVDVSDDDLVIQTLDKVNREIDRYINTFKDPRDHIDQINKEIKKELEKSFNEKIVIGEKINRGSIGNNRGNWVYFKLKNATVKPFGYFLTVGIYGGVSVQFVDCLQEPITDSAGFCD